MPMKPNLTIVFMGVVVLLSAGCNRAPNWEPVASVTVANSDVVVIVKDWRELSEQDKWVIKRLAQSCDPGTVVIVSHDARTGVYRFEYPVRSD